MAKAHPEYRYKYSVYYEGFEIVTAADFLQLEKAPLTILDIKRVLFERRGFEPSQQVLFVN